MNEALSVFVLNILLLTNPNNCITRSMQSSFQITRKRNIIRSLYNIYEQLCHYNRQKKKKKSAVVKYLI